MSNIGILLSIPGLGNGGLAVLLSEASNLLEERDYHALRCLGRVAPVSKRSGKILHVLQRRASNLRPITALYHWCRVAIQHDPISKAKYQGLRRRGHSHGRALRSVADWLLKMACVMLRNGTRFDSNRKSAAAQAG